jgi:hypothetical protein
MLITDSVSIFFFFQLILCTVHALYSFMAEIVGDFSSKKKRVHVLQVKSQLEWLSTLDIPPAPDAQLQAKFLRKVLVCSLPRLVGC